MEQPTRDLRLPALRRFALAITVLNVLGHLWFGFEQSWATPLVALATAYATEILLERLDAWRQGRPPRFPARGIVPNIDFLLSAHISGLAVGMLLYADDRLWPIVFATTVAISSKHLLRVEVNGKSRHFLNPSNTGISATLLAFPSVGLAQPYMFTANLSPAGAWILPCIMILTGSFLNGRFTKKLPLIAGWVGGFFLQAVLRHLLFGNLLSSALVPMSGVAFLLFTFYMVTDPATTPVPPRRQLAFGAAVSLTYGLLVSLHIVFGLLFALTLVCSLRGASLYVAGLASRRALQERPWVGEAARTAPTEGSVPSR